MPLPTTPSECSMSLKAARTSRTHKDLGFYRAEITSHTRADQCNGIDTRTGSSTFTDNATLRPAATAVISIGQRLLRLPAILAALSRSTFHSIATAHLIHATSG